MDIFDCESTAVLNTSETEYGIVVPDFMSGVKTPPSVSIPRASVVV
jgi:hypothetical protein